ncbi:hypothetical protein GGR50DRAFT_697682 [Xylaria sp. CBS 124048]|nr:hypothetical protein GGR50DRAFT_697682 [Xylaria sp. CBS 124048]
MDGGQFLIVGGELLNVPRPVAIHDEQRHQWETELLPFEIRGQVRGNPCDHRFDNEYLTIIQDWSVSLGQLLQFRDAVGSLTQCQPFELDCLAFTTTACFNLIHQYFLLGHNNGPRENIPDHPTMYRDSVGRGVPRTDVAMARLVITELLCMDFGGWLESLQQIIRKGQGKMYCTFRADFVDMKLECVTVDEIRPCQVWSSLPIFMLFPSAYLQQADPWGVLRQWSYGGFSHGTLGGCVGQYENGQIPGSCDTLPDSGEDTEEWDTDSVEIILSHDDVPEPEFRRMSLAEW